MAVIGNGWSGTAPLNTPVIRENYASENTSADVAIARRIPEWHSSGMSRTAAPPQAPCPYRFSVEEYHRLGETGFFQPEDRVELLNGEIIIMPAIGVRHMNAVRRLINVLTRRLGERCLLDAQNPLMIDGQSEPQPDILLLKPGIERTDSAPIPEDVLLLVEVADSSLVYDQTDKRDAYARNGIGEYWLLDLTRNELIVFRDSDGQRYRSEERVRATESIAPVAFPDEPIPVREILPGGAAT
jgi:Uma2 family endonuclease